MPAKWNPGDPDDIIRRYVAGESEYALARDYHVSNDAVATVLRRGGIERRSFSAAQYARFARESPDARLARRTLLEQTAWASRKGSVSQEEMCRRAQGRELSLSQKGAGEDLFARWLRDGGLEPVQQMAIDKYNIDFAILPVAVELLRDPANPLVRPTDRKKIEYLCNRGISVHYIWVSRSCFQSPIAAEDAIAFHNRISANPPAIGKYRVIRGCGHFVAEASFDADRFTYPRTPRHKHYSGRSPHH